MAECSGDDDDDDDNDDNEECSGVSGDRERGVEQGENKHITHLRCESGALLV